MSRWRVLVAEPGGWANPVVLPLNGGAFSWPVSDTGTANVEVMTADLRAAGLLPARDRLAGRWLRWDHPTLGAWAGVVTAPRSHGATGTTEVVAKAFDRLLAGRRTPKVSDAGMANPGAVLRRAIDDRHRAGDPIRLALDEDQQGVVLPSIQRAADLHDLLVALARDAAWEWRVDHAARRLEFRPRVGRDRSADVTLVEGAAVLDYDLAFDAEAIVNELLAVPADEPYARTRTLVVRDEDSISRHGLRQGTETFSRLVTRAGLRSVAEGRLARLTAQGDTVEVALADRGRVWAAFAEGDTVTVVLPSANARLRARAMVRAYDLETDLLRVSCEVEEVLS